MKKVTTAAASHCLGTSIHIHVNQVLVALTLCRHSGRIGRTTDDSSSIKSDWMLETYVGTATHEVRVGCCFLVPLSQEHTTSVEMLSGKRENWECIGSNYATQGEVSGTSRWEASANSVHFSQMLRFHVCCLQEMKPITIILSH